MSLIFKATNPGATTAIWPQPTGWRHEAYFDKPDALSLDMAGYHGVADRAIIEAYRADEGDGDSFSDVVFRGYLLPPDEAGSKVSKASIPSIEKILDGSRWTVPVRYPAGTTLTKMLTHDWPASSVEKPGLLCMANNMIQPGSFIHHSGDIWKLPQGGTSYIGNLHTLGDHVYVDSVKQSLHVSPALASGEYYQDADYLYIFSTRNPYYSIVLAEGVYETNIRLGTIETGSTTFAYSWRVGAANIYKEITRLILATNQEWQFSHNQDGYTYLNVASSIGRGASNTNYPTYRYDLCEIVKQKRNTTGGARPVHALRGEGIGKGQSKQYYTEASFPQGLRFVERAEYSSQFADQLQGTIGKLYDNYQDQRAWKIIAEDDPGLMPGDWIKIVPEFDQPVIERVKQITRSSDSPMVIYAGQRPLDSDDVLRAKADWRDAMQKDLDLQYATISASGQENVDNTYPCEILLDVPSENWDGELDSTWLMSVKIGPYEASTNTIQHPQTNHGAAGADTTSGSGGAHDDHDLGGITSGVGAGTLVGFNVETGYQIDEGSDHYHDVDAGTTYYVPYALDHSHSYANGTYPDEAAAHTVPLKVNPATDATKSDVIDRATALGGTHSWLAYVTVTIKIINSLYPSGQDVPGSPFADIALNESISDIDVSGMVVTGANTVRISIARYGTPGPGETSVVRARASVNLSGKIVVDTN